MKRISLAVEGSPPTDEVRVELMRSPDYEPRLLAAIQEDRPNSLALLFRGCVRMGTISIPAIIKLQRLASLTGESRSLVSAKLDREHALNSSLQETDLTNFADRVPLLQLLRLDTSSTTEADVLPPSIVCSKARHAITPRCPVDGTELLAEELVADEKERSLSCPRCGAVYFLDPSSLEAVFNGSVQKDDACANCFHRTHPLSDTCQRYATFLNPVPSRMLVFESWEFDLHEYLHWQQGMLPPANKRDIWTRLDDQRRKLKEVAFTNAGSTHEQVSEGTFTLWQTVNLFTKIVDAVDQLHNRSVAHLNLNTECIVLNVDSGHLQVRITNLTHSHHSDHALSWQQLQMLTPPDPVFAAPECLKPSRSKHVRFVRWRADECELEVEESGLTSTGLLDARFNIGDWFAVDVEAIQRHRYLVKSVLEIDGFWFITGERCHLETPSHPDSTQASELSVKPLPDNKEHWTEAANVEVMHHRHIGMPADIFSLGMLLLHLLCPQKELLTRYRKAVATAPWDRLLPATGLPLDKRPPQSLVETLLAQTSTTSLNEFRDCEAHLTSYGASRPIAQGLLGIVLRATVRGDSEHFYLTDRAGDARTAIQLLRQDLERLGAELRSPPPTLLPQEAIVFGMFQQPFIQSFRQCWDTPRVPLEAIEPLEDWRLKHTQLQEQLNRFDAIHARLKEKLDEFQSLLSDPLHKAWKAHTQAVVPKDPLYLTLPGTPASLTRKCADLSSVIKEMDTLYQEILARRHSAFERLLPLGERWHRHFGLNPASQTQSHLLEEYSARWEKKFQEWQTQFVFVLAPLRRYIHEIRASLITPWEQCLLNSTWLQRVWHPTPPGAFAISLAQLESLRSIQPLAALDLLRRCHLGPAVEVDAALAVLQFEALQSSSAFDTHPEPLIRLDRSSSGTGLGHPHVPKEVTLARKSPLLSPGTTLELGFDDL